MHSSPNDWISLFLHGVTAKLDKDHKFIAETDSQYNFQEHYNKEIFPLVLDFERKRIKALESFRLYFVIAIIISILIVIISHKIISYYNVTNKQSLEGAFYLVCISIFSVITLSYLPLINYRNAVKDFIFPKIFSFFGPDYTYQRFAVIDYNKLQSTAIMPICNFYNSEDLVTGIYKNVGIELYELTLKYDEHKRNKTQFKGLIIQLTMNKNFKGHTIIKNDRGALVNFLSSTSSSLEKVRLEDSRFEGEFDVFSTDQVESRYLLTPAFMERFRKLKAVSRSPQIEAAFLNNNLILKISLNYNRFEPSSILQPATFEDDIKILISEMSLIFEIIDVLKLNEKTGL